MSETVIDTLDKVRIVQPSDSLSKVGQWMSQANIDGAISIDLLKTITVLFSSRYAVIMFG